MLLKRRSQKVDVLRKVPLLSGLSAQHLDLIAKHADEVTVKEGTVLARQGSLGSELFVVLDGRAQVAADGKSMAHLEAGDLIGEMSLIDQKPRSATVTAKTQMVLLVIEARAFSALLDDVPALRKKVMITLCDRLRAVDAQLAMRN
jgi:CRP-like cAMP-binding protein